MISAPQGSFVYLAYMQWVTFEKPSEYALEKNIDHKTHMVLVGVYSSYEAAEKALNNRVTTLPRVRITGEFSKASLNLNPANDDFYTSWQRPVEWQSPYSKNTITLNQLITIEQVE